MRPTVLIASFDTDLHARAVQQELARRDVRVVYLSTDRLVGTTELTWGAGSCRPPTLMLRTEDGDVDAASIDLVWWRRAGTGQAGTESFERLDADLIDNDWRAACLGGLWTTVRGIWLNDPWATTRAENKLVQFAAAVQCGLCVPDTAVTNAPEVVSRLLGEGPAAMKPVRGSLLHPLLTVRVTPQQTPPPESISVAPAIYQSYVDGSEHLRINWFGTRVITARISSEHEDWRGHLPECMEPAAIDGELRRRLGRLFDTLGLRMGIVDVKLDAHGTPHWLEVNPQGQFLFCEGLGVGGILDAFTDYLGDLIEESRRGSLAAAPSS